MRTAESISGWWGATVVAVLVGFAVLTPGVQGQADDRRWEIGGAVGAVFEYPEPLVDCGTEVGAASASVTRWLGVQVGLMLSTSAGFDRGGDACPLPGSPQAPIGPGTRTFQHRIDDGLFGSGYWASDLSMVFDLSPGDRFGLRLLGGTGRLWAGEVWRWTLGGDVVWETAAGSPFLGMRARWFQYDFERDLIEYDENLNPVVIETERVEKTATPVLVQLGYRIRIR